MSIPSLIFFVHSLLTVFRPENISICFAIYPTFLVQVPMDTQTGETTTWATTCSMSITVSSPPESTAVATKGYLLIEACTCQHWTEFVKFAVTKGVLHPHFVGSQRTSSSLKTGHRKTSFKMFPVSACIEQFPYKQNVYFHITLKDVKHRSLMWELSQTFPACLKTVPTEEIVRHFFVVNDIDQNSIISRSYWTYKFPTRLLFFDYVLVYFRKVENLLGWRFNSKNDAPPSPFHKLTPCPLSSFVSTAARNSHQKRRWWDTT